MALSGWLLRYFIFDYFAIFNIIVFNGPNLKNFLTILSALSLGSIFDQIYDFYFDNKFFINGEKETKDFSPKNSKTSMFCEKEGESSTSAPDKSNSNSVAAPSSHKDIDPESIFTKEELASLHKYNKEYARGII